MSTWREKVKGQRPSAPGSRHDADRPSFRGMDNHSKGSLLPGAAGGVQKRSAGMGKGNGRGKGKGAGKGKGKGKGGASLGGQIRGLQRTLAHSGASMTPAARAAKEEEIASLRALAEDRKRRERERTLAKKYHMVKFFERRKIERRISAVQDLLLAPDADAEELEKRKKSLEDDLAYVTNFPKDIPYVSLFPSAGHTDESVAEVARIREIIKNAAAVKTEQSSIAAAGSKDPNASAQEGEGPSFAEDDEEDDFFL